MGSAALLPPPLRDDRGKAFCASLDVAVGLDPTIVHVLDIDNAPAVALPELARQFNVLGPLWNAQTSDSARRSLLKLALSLWAKAGTKSGLEMAIALAGFLDCHIRDVNDGLRYNGAANFDGTHDYGENVGAWYLFWVELSRSTAQGYSQADHANIQILCQTFAPRRSALERVRLLLAPSAVLSGLPISTDLASVAVSSDGTTWTSHAALASSIDSGAHTATVHGRIYAGEAPGTSVSHVAVMKHDGTVLAQVAWPALWKATDVDLDMTWSLTW